MFGPLREWLSPYLSNSGTSSLTFQTMQVFLTRAGGLVLALFSSLALTRWLGLSAFGEYAYIVSWVTILTIPSIGMGTLVVRETAIARRHNDAETFGGLLGWSLGNTLRVSGALTLIGLIAVSIYANEISPGVRLAPLLGLVGIPLIGLQTLIGAVFRGCRRVDLTIFINEIVSSGLMMIWAGGCLFIGIRASASMALGGRLIVLVLVLITYAAFLPRVGIQWQRASSTPDQKRAWRKSMSSMAMLKGIDIVVARLPVIILGFFIGPVPVALFALSLRIAETVVFTLSIVSLTTGPRLAELHAKRDYSGMQQLVTRSTLVITAWAVPVALFLILAGQWLLGWFGPQFKAGYPILLVLVVGQTVDAITGTVALVMTMGGMESVVVKTHAFGLLLTAALCAVLVPTWGALGAAIGFTAALIFWNVVLAVQLYRRLGIVSTVLCDSRGIS